MIHGLGTNREAQGSRYECVDKDIIVAPTQTIQAVQRLTVDMIWKVLSKQDHHRYADIVSESYLDEIKLEDCLRKVRVKFNQRVAKHLQVVVG